MDTEFVCLLLRGDDTLDRRRPPSHGRSRLTHGYIFNDGRFGSVADGDRRLMHASTNTAKITAKTRLK
ncbi:MAG: hypothetical protein CMH52_11900 [Myxococcales bacterium]|nr:hypothetical protein [Myxococcales bacterium]